MATIKYDVQRFDGFFSTCANMGKNTLHSFGDVLDLLLNAQVFDSVGLQVASTTNGVTPSSSSNTYGTAFTVSPPSGVVCSPNPADTTTTSGSLSNTITYGAINLNELDFALASVGSETITCQVIATYNDGSTVTLNNLTSTTSQTISYLMNGVAKGTTFTYQVATSNLMALQVQGKFITSLACAIKSSISSSTATCTVTAYGTANSINNLPMLH